MEKWVIAGAVAFACAIVGGVYLVWQGWTIVVSLDPLSKSLLSAGALAGGGFLTYVRIARARSQ